MNSESSFSVTRQDHPLVPGGSATVSRERHPPVPEGLYSVTSSWALLGGALLRFVRRTGMPVAWAVALGICAASGFAVRDVLFPSIGAGAAPSVWQSRSPETSAPSTPPRGAMTALDGPQPRRANTTAAATTSVAAPAVTDDHGGSAHLPQPDDRPNVQSGPPTASASVNDHGGSTASGSGSPTSSVDDHHATDPTTHHVASSSTVQDDASGPSSTGGTGGTLAGGSGRGGSGPGGGGDAHDSIP